MNKKKILIVTASAVIAALLFLYLRSDERQVRKRFETLAELVSKAGGESPVVLALRARQTGELFSDPCTVEAGGRFRGGRYTPKEIAGHAASARVLFNTLSLKFYDLHIVFPEKGRAVARVTGMLSGTTKQEERFDETHEVEVELIKTNEGWRFSAIRAVQVLER